MRSMHIIGSSELGGAESFYLRLVHALAAVPGHEAIAIPRRGGQVSALLADTIRRHCVGLHNGWDALSVLAIRRLVHELRPDIVQTYMGRATRLTRVPRNAPAVHVARLGGFYKIDGYYRHADAWVGNTAALCDYLVRNGLPANRIYRIGNFVDVPPPTPAETLAALRRRHRIAEDAVVAFALGRFVDKKGVADLLQAFAGLPREIDSRPLMLVIAGDGPQSGALARQATALGIAERVRWVGWQTDATPYFHLAQVFVCPSRDEPLGNVILEAWAHGLPVVSTATAGAAELIRPDEDALVAEAHNPAALSGALGALLGAGATAWEQLAGRGRETLTVRHGRSAVVGAYLSMYAELIGRGGTS